MLTTIDLLWMLIFAFWVVLHITVAFTWNNELDASRALMIRMKVEHERQLMKIKNTSRTSESADQDAQLEIDAYRRNMRNLRRDATKELMMLVLSILMVAIPVMGALALVSMAFGAIDKILFVINAYKE